MPDLVEPPRAAWIQHIGNATVLIRYGAFTLLTDPNFLHQGDHVHLGYGLTAERLTNPAIELDELPPLDLVLLSHLHEDHFDREVARRLSRDVPIVSTPTAVRALRKMGFSAARALGTWESLHIEKEGIGLRITAMPGQHGPRLLSKLLPPVMGSMLDWSAGGQRLWRLYISGDTMVHAQLREVPRRFPDVDLAFLHLGGTRILGVFVTMDAAEGVQALQLISPREAIPIHYDDYTVFKSPLRDFQRAVEAAGLADRVRYLVKGEVYRYEIPRLRGVEPEAPAPGP